MWRCWLGRARSGPLQRQPVDQGRVRRRKHGRTAGDRRVRRRAPSSCPEHGSYGSCASIDGAALTVDRATGAPALGRALEVRQRTRGRSTASRRSGSTAGFARRWTRACRRSARRRFGTPASPARVSRSASSTAVSTASTRTWLAGWWRPRTSPRDGGAAGDVTRPRHARRVDRGRHRRRVRRSVHRRRVRRGAGERTGAQRVRRGR